MITLRRLLALACLLLLNSGCVAFTLSTLAEKPEKPWLAANSIAAEAVISITGDKPVSGRALILAKSPAYFRIDVKGAFGATAALLVSDAKSITISSGGNTSVYAKGQNNPYIPYGFTPDELVTLLLGAKNVDTASIKTTFKDFDVTTDANGNIIALKKQGDGEQNFNLLLSDFKNTSGASFPSSITIEDGYKTISIRYTKIEVNPDISNDSFAVPAPEPK
ncbi:hypothetical protein EPN18_02935 [bacterium]|nr:MAG: hypothetical protein EPN18_02935 [bacterium]